VISIGSIPFKNISAAGRGNYVPAKSPDALTTLKLDNTGINAKGSITSRGTVDMLSPDNLTGEISLINNQFAVNVGTGATTSQFIATNGGFNASATDTTTFSGNNLVEFVSGSTYLSLASAGGLFANDETGTNTLTLTSAGMDVTAPYLKLNTHPVVIDTRTVNGHALSSDVVVSASDLTTGTLATGHGGTGTTTSFTQGSIVYAGASGNYAQDNANFNYNPTGVFSGPAVDLGPQGSNPDDAVFEVYAATAGNPTAHFHNNGVQGATGGGKVSLNSTPTGTPAAMASGSRLGMLEFGGTFDSTMTLKNGGDMSCLTTQAWTSTHAGSKLIFNTIPNNSTTKTLALTLDQDQSATFASSVTLAGETNSGNLAFTGTGNRITGDFTNATKSNRVMFQTSTTNGASAVGIIPNGSASSGTIGVYSASTPDNATQANLTTSGLLSTLQTIAAGTGNYIPLTFKADNAEVMRFTASGTNTPGANPHVLIGATTETAGAEKLQVTGAILATSTIAAGSGTNTVYYCNGGVSVGNLCRGNGCSCVAGSWVATSLKLD